MALTKLTQNLIDGTLVTSVNSLTGAVTLETGTDWVNTIQTSNFTAVAGKGYFVNTTSGGITITLPAGTVGNEVVIQDYAGTFGTNNVILNANGSEKIQGTSSSIFKIVTNNATCTLVYQDATKGWTADNLTEQVVFTTNYLVLAGGGGAGGAGGGGGAGGLRTSYGSTSGGGGSAESSLSLDAGTNYVVTIGAGGGGCTGGSTRGIGVQGNNSVFSTITSTGGGPGAGFNNNSPSTSFDGGSGGGCINAASSGTYIDGGDGVTNQGYDGGRGYRTDAGYNSGGGGGGVGAAGADGAGSSSSPVGGAGGNGLAVSISGSSVTYGVGGVGAAETGSASQASNEPDNSGNGGDQVNNLFFNINGANGGSGVVILRYPSTATLTNPGAGLTMSTATDGSDKVTTLTAGTGNIQLN